MGKLYQIFAIWEMDKYFYFLKWTDLRHNSLMALCFH